MRTGITLINVERLYEAVNAVIPIRIIIDNVVVFGILPVCEDILEQMRIVAG